MSNCKVMIASAMLSSIVFWGSSAVLADVPAHKCTECHLEGNKLKQENINELCLSCHPSNSNDHKIGVIPAKAPSGLPLDKESKISCLTCHDLHGNAEGSKLLRKKKDNLCLTCHDK